MNSIIDWFQSENKRPRRESVFGSESASVKSVRGWTRSCWPACVIYLITGPRRAIKKITFTMDPSTLWINSAVTSLARDPQICREWIIEKFARTKMVEIGSNRAENRARPSKRVEQVLSEHVYEVISGDILCKSIVCKCWSVCVENIPVVD